MRMQKTVAVGLVLAGAALLPGCRSLGSGGGTGALIGGLLGAGGGYAVGHHKGNTTNWALAGAAAGALAGYFVGDQVESHRAASRAGPETIVGSDRYVVRERIVGPGAECDPTPPGW